MTASRVTVYPDHCAVLAACRIATAGEHRTALVSSSDAGLLTSDGVRVGFTTREEQELALAHLRALGYEARADSRPIHDERGEGILVTGWDVSALEWRASWGERAVHELVSEYARLAREALDTYRAYVDDLHLTHPEASECILQAFTRRAADRPHQLAREVTAQTYASAPVSDAERRGAPHPVSVLLRRIAIAETAHRKLTDCWASTVRDTIGLYLEYRHRHGHDPDSAAQHAVAEASEGADACSVLADLELEARDC